jgi:hypothetical protein
VQDGLGIGRGRGDALEDPGQGRLLLQAVGQRPISVLHGGSQCGFASTQPAFSASNSAILAYGSSAITSTPAALPLLGDGARIARD